MNRDERTVFSLGAFVVAVFAIFVAFWAVFLVRDDDGSGAGAVAAPATIDVDLSDFKIGPPSLDIPESGATLRLTNSGSSAHNLAIPQLNVQSADVQPGESATVTVDGSTAAGMYEMLCTIAGHADAGMKGMVYTGGAATATDGTTDGSTTGAAGSEPLMDQQTMDRIMDEVALKFPAATEGHGGEVLEPTILADGTKQFDLTAEIVDWEVEPGKIVQAWTYNGVVPAPEIRVDVGDKVKVVLTNNLPESTTIHYHGVRVPNSMDGVPPYTQAPVKPGETFTYEFEALEPAVGIYHSHHNAQVQVPNGMFGAFLIGEMPIPQKLIDEGITKIDKQVTMVLNDAGTIGLSLNGKSFPATEPYTLAVGETMLVHYMNEGLLGHPMHLHQPVGWIIAKDGTPLDEPMPGDTIWISPGERYSVLYTAVDPGVWAWHCHILTHAEGSQGMFGMVTALIVEE
ncbi:MAG TPA: multicopper oxidase domain-containing protein [Ilumatobacteraceae bacterium]